MIILPETPPLPTSIAFRTGALNPQLISTRVSLATAVTKNNNELIRYVVRLEAYLEELFKYANTETNSNENSNMIQYCCKYVISDSGVVPWTNIIVDHIGEQLKNKRIVKVFNKAKSISIQWYLINEIEVIVIVISLIYTKLGSVLINELIDVDLNCELSDETNEKWKQVVNYYKKSLSFLSFGDRIRKFFDSDYFHLNSLVYSLLEKINNICIQMSILSKSSWIHRNYYNETESFKTNNNGTLCKVAIYVINELKDCQSISHNIQKSNDGSIKLQYTKWNEYLSIIEKYATAYASLFLSIEKYQQDSVGLAIGLINFGLLSLQSKNLNDVSPKQGKLIAKLKSRVSVRKNELYIKDLKSITTLNIDNSVFQESSGIILKDLTFLFDQLIQLHLKFTKENNNIKFDTVSAWQDIDKDSKWPLGSNIPTSSVKPYEPFGDSVGKTSKDEYSGRGAYY